MLIGTLAKESGFSRDTIRYYEKRGLLGDRGYNRRPNNYKEYSSEALERLQAIRRLKSHGFTLGEIRELVSRLVDTPGCDGLPEKLAEKRRDVEEQITQLQQYHARLTATLARCGGPNCRRALSYPA